MRKLTTVGLLLLVFVGVAVGQVTLSLPTTTAANGTALALPVQVTGFNHVGSFSLTISFDKNALTYTGTANQPTFGLFNSTPAGTANTNGSVSISWFNVSPALNIGTGKLLDLLFTYNSGTSALTFTNTIPSSVTDSLGNNLAATYTNGQVSGLPSRISLSSVVSSPGPVFVSLTGDNLKGLGSISLRIAFDTASVTFVGLSNPALPFTAGTPSAGVLALSWFSTTPFSLNTGKLTDLQFTLKKDSTNLTVQGTSQVTDSVGNNLTITYVNGKIAKTPAPPLPPVGLTLPTLKAVPGKDITFPVTVTLMNNIGSVSLKISYDQTKLTFKQISNFPGTGYVSNAAGGVLSFAWFGFPYLNIGTGKLMDLVFTYSGGTSAVAFNSTQSQVTDSAANTLTVSFGNGVVNQDSIPHFTPISAKTVAQLDSLSFAALATDADAGDTLTYSAGALPAGAQFDAVSKSFGWRPTLSTKPQVYNVWFYVIDQWGGNDSAMAAITVTKTNFKPSFVDKMRDTSVAESKTLAFTYIATDPNADSLTFSLVSAPTGAAITAAGVFSWSPTFGQNGTYTITAVVSDGALTDTAQATVVVTKTNRKPAFSAVLKDTLINEGSTLTYTYAATDPDGNPLTYSLVSAPSGASMTTAGVLTFTPPAKPARTYSLVAVVSDGALTDTARATVTVNRKPLFNFRFPAQVPTVSQNKAQTFAVSATDPDGGALTFVWKLNGIVDKTGADSSYTKTFSDPHGATKYIVCIFSESAGLKDSTRWDFTITDIATDDGVIPTEFALGQNYPNPFNPTTTIRFDLPKEAPVMLEIYNVLGVRVRTLLRGESISAGRHLLTWDGRDENGAVAPTGVYLYRISAGDFHASKKMTLLK